MISSESIVSCREGLSVADLGGEAVLLDSESGQYFGLNNVGQFIVERIKKPHRVDELIQAVSEEYSIDLGTAERDMTTFLDEMIDAKLVVVR